MQIVIYEEIYFAGRPPGLILGLLWFSGPHFGQHRVFNLVGWSV